MRGSHPMCCMWVYSADVQCVSEWYGVRVDLCRRQSGGYLFMSLLFSSPYSPLLSSPLLFSPHIYSPPLPSPRLVSPPPRYRERRQAIADYAFRYEAGTPIAHWDYNEAEIKTWGTVYVLRLFPFIQSDSVKPGYYNSIRTSVYVLKGLKESYLQRWCTRVLVRPCSHLKRCLPRVLTCAPNISS